MVMRGCRRRVVGVVGALGACLLGVAPSWAAEGFQLRYNLAGSLGGEIFAPPNQSGWAGGIAATYISVSQITGDDGLPLRQAIPGGVVALPSPTPSSLYPSYAANSALVDGTGSLRQLNFGLAYFTTEQYAGGRLAFAFNLPYAKKTQSFSASAATPALQWNPAVPGGTQAVVNGQFATSYQASIAAQAASETGEVSGFGDAEFQAGWLYADARLRVLAGLSLVVPTGEYSASAGPDIGFGNFYTLRPSVQVGYLITPNWGVAGKLTLGLNSRNRDNNLRSGNWAGAELAAGYKSPIGVIGVHGISVRQMQDDSNNVFGASRLQVNTMGVFFTTLIPGLDAAVTVQQMRTTSSRNAKVGDYTQIRISKLF